MLVLSRKAGDSIRIDGPGSACVVTLLKVQRDAVDVLINQLVSTHSGTLDSRVLQVPLNTAVHLADGIRVTLVDLREDKARLGIDAPLSWSVHRLEIYEVLKRQNDADDDRPSDDLGGAPVPRNPQNAPPSLGARQDPPVDGNQ